VYTCVDHWFNGENVSRFHETCCFIVGVMRDRRSAVKQASNSMTAVCSINGESASISYLPILFDIFADNIAHLSVHSARLTYFEGLLKTVVGLFY
jgi:hypothetical protein